MARRREDRYAAAAEFQRDLQTLRDRYSSPMTSASLSAGVPESSSRTRWRLRAAEAAKGQGRFANDPSVPAELREADGDIKGDPTEVYVRPAETPVPAIEDEDEDEDEPTQLMAPRRPLLR